jgi:gas vesicle protein
MKSRNREINIFNVSLIDILCGAMGAFCFMVLVLLPFWKATGPDAEAATRSVKDMEQQIRELREQLAKTGSAADASQMLDQLQKKLQGLQGQLNQALAKVQEREQEVSALNAKVKRKDELIDDLGDRNPITVEAEWFSPKHDVDLYIWPSYQSRKGTKPDPPDPTKHQSTFFSTEISTQCTEGPCSEVYMLRDNQPGGELRVYYKYIASNGVPGPVTVSGFYLYDGSFFRLPRATIQQEKSMVHVGTIRFDADYRAQFQPAPEYAQVYKEQLERDGQRRAASQ